MAAPAVAQPEPDVRATSIDLVAAVSRRFADGCVAGIVADAERCRAYAESSPALATDAHPAQCRSPDAPPVTQRPNERFYR